MLVRINKYLASLGIGSRRQIDTTIGNRKVYVNDRFATLGQKIDPSRDKIVYRKKLIQKLPEKKVYYLLNKPKNVLSTTHDDRGRKTVIDYVPRNVRLFPVGRLDYDSTGAIILTNDGNLALRLTHPRYHLSKTYQVIVKSPVSQKQLDNLATGVNLDDGITAPAQVKVIQSDDQYTLFNITLFEGRNRQIKRMCQFVRLPFVSLHRTAIGPVLLGQLGPGQHRPLSSKEVEQLTGKNQEKTDLRPHRQFSSRSRPYLRR